MNLTRKKILLGIGGGIAAYKAIEVASLIKKLGINVFVAMSPGAKEFISPLTFEASTGNPVSIDIFPGKNNGNPFDLFPHLYPASEADAFLMLPATADLMAKIAVGIGDDIVSASALALSQECQCFFCPAMNSNMWNQSVVQTNVKTLKKRGWIQIGPETGIQACGTIGPGRMTEPAQIVDLIGQSLLSSQKLKGKKILIFSGPTYEFIDPVRFIGNASSGKMGKALAEEAVFQGATVTFVTGPVSNENLPFSSTAIKIVNVTSGEEMFNRGKELFQEADITVFAAAVADYQVAKFKEQKISSGEKDLMIELKPSRDIAESLGQNKMKHQITFGFALETENEKDKAFAKLKRKKFDYILLNTPASLGNESGDFTLLDANGKIDCWGDISKTLCARKVFDLIN